MFTTSHDTINTEESLRSEEKGNKQSAQTCDKNNMKKTPDETGQNRNRKQEQRQNSEAVQEKEKENESGEEKYRTTNIGAEKETEETNYDKMNKIDLINEIKKTKKSINEKNLDNKILKEKYLSVLAENENLRNRYLKEIENSKIYCITNFAKSLLDVADNLSLAIQNINEESLKKNEEINNIHKGIQMTETILHNIFNNYGINKYNPINEKFNPLLHEAIYEINDVTKEKGTVATVIQHGYKIKDRILRAAKVGVVKN